MDWVHGHSRVTSGASRLHHLAGVTQVAPGGPTNEWQGLRAQQPPTGLLASKWVISTSLYTASTPVTMTGLLGDETWGMGRREASRETRDQEVTSDFPTNFATVSTPPSRWRDPPALWIWGVERREASREGRPEASRETRNQEVTSDFPNKSRHREYPRRNDETHRLCDLEEGTPWGVPRGTPWGVPRDSQPRGNIRLSQQISPPWEPPSPWRDPPALKSGGGTPWGVPRGTPWGVPWDSWTRR